MGLLTPTQITCPVCGHRYTRQVHQSVDAQSEPHLKQLLVQERLNITTCPQCQNQIMLAVPVLYHDASKPMFAVFMPMGAARSDVHQQQMVGALTNRFMSDLPPEERKGYMLQPKMYLTLQSLADDIMLADGLTREEIEARRQRTALLERLLSSQTPEELQNAIEASLDQLDDTFFDVLDTWIRQAEAQGDEEMAEALASLRRQLRAAVAPEEAAQEEADAAEQRRELLEVLLNERNEERLRAMVAAVRPVLDYHFFLQIADRIDAAQEAGNEIEAKRLTRARATILQMLDELEEEDRQALTQAAEFLRQAISQPALEDYLRQNSERLDEAFFAVLNMNIAEARRRNDENTARALGSVGAIAAKIMEEKAPPELRLLNELLRAAPQERARLLEERSELVTDEFVAALQQMQRAVGKANSQISQQLAALAEQVAEFRGRNGQGG
ncbi:MAG: hypothetical protein HPY83_16880 [Anaerolineae bacterium]|nr:hypothetical protein [Anaerolineae bacterium]